MKALGLAATAALLLVALFKAPAAGGVGTVMQSPSPTPSGSAQPSATPSSSPSPTASSSPSEPVPDPDYRRVRLATSRRDVRVGGNVTFSGTIDANRPGCSVGARISLKRLIFGTRRRLTVADGRTDVNGHFRFKDAVRWNSLYTAVAARKGACPRTESDPRAVYAHVRVGIRVTDETPTRFSNVRIRGRVRPSHPDGSAILQMKRDGRWRSVQRGELSERSTFSFFPYASWKGTRVFRIKWPQSDRDHSAGTSRAIQITTHS